MLEEGETEVEKETDQISVETGEGSGVGEGHIEAFHLGRVKNTQQHNHNAIHTIVGTSICFVSRFIRNSFLYVNDLDGKS